MMNAASTSNPSFIANVGEIYPYPSHVIAPNFVTMKLSGKDTYNVWETQILCLLKGHHMLGFIDSQFPSPAGNGKGKEEDIDAWVASDSLLKGWILGSLSDGVAKKVVNRLKPKHRNTDFTAKDVWDELRCSYAPSVHEQAAETNITPRQAEIVIELRSVFDDEKSKDEPTEEKNRDENKDPQIRFYDFILAHDTRYVINNLEKVGLRPWDKFMNNGNTVLHVAVGSSTKNHELLEKLLEMTPKENTLLDLVNSDGSTLLHVAAIGGNIEAVNLLVERNPELLLATDKEGHTPLALSVSNMHTMTSHYLFEHMKEHGYGNTFSGQIGEDLVILAISCQDFSLADMIINEYPDGLLSDSDAVLTTLAQNIPRELNFWEKRDFRKEFYNRIDPYSMIRRFHRIEEEYIDDRICSLLRSIMLFMFLYAFIYGFHAAVIGFSFFLKAIVHPFVKDTSQVFKDAKSLLSNVCKKILLKDNSSTYNQYYNSSIFEATRRNSSTFIRFIMRRFPDAIWSANEDGHTFIQYSVINRSEKIYNLLNEMSEHKNIYKTIKDSFGNNLLHLAARLAPASKLNLISGAALQIQRELQWFKEVERFVCPLNRIQKNLDDETPQMVFTREHKDLVIEGENWIKKTAESYTITAALIITVVFAAAITVPGGNNQDSGIPVFTNNIAFRVFAISDAISLFTAVTSLLIFLSILTARFAEQDFLFKLPTKLIIGLTMLFISTTAMIIAFGATLFLVFGQSNSSTLIPIGALTCLPITSFVTLQFPLIVELICATY